MKAVLLLPLMLALCLPGTGVADVLAVRGVALAHACAGGAAPERPMVALLALAVPMAASFYLALALIRRRLIK